MSYRSDDRRKSLWERDRWLLAVFLLTIVPRMLFAGWVLSVLWNWFIPEIFPALPNLSAGKAICLTLVVSALVDSGRSSKDEDLFSIVFESLVVLVVEGFTLLILAAIIRVVAF